MHSIDFEQISEAEFIKLKKLRKLLMGEPKVDTIYPVLKETLPLLNQITNSKQSPIIMSNSILEEIYSELVFSYLHQVVQISSKLSTIRLLVLYTRFMQVSLPVIPSDTCYLKLDIGPNAIWPQIVTHAYRYTSSNLMNRFCFGAHIMVTLSQSKALLLTYWLGGVIGHVPIDDLPQIWTVYHQAYQQLLDYCDLCHSQTWFWHLGVRGFLQTLKRQVQIHHQRVVKNLGKQFNLDTHYEAFVKLVPISGVVDDLLPAIFSSAERLAFALRLQVYHPVQAAAYKHIQLEPLTIAEKQLLKQSAYQTAKSIIERRPLSLYQNQKYIAALCLKPFSIRKGFIERLFPQTVARYSSFWYQFKDYASNCGYTQDLALLEQLFIDWCYESSTICKMRFQKLDPQKIARRDLIKVYSAYDSCLSLPHIQFVLQKLRSIAFIDSGVSFKTYQHLDIIWSSVLVFVQTPRVYIVSFAKDIQQILKKQMSLQAGTRQYIQSYLAVLAKYIWLQRWHSHQVRSFVSELQNQGGDTWRRGMLNIVQTLNEQSYKQRQESRIREVR
ncbi:MAG: hypothetical protein VXW87_02215 [Pseudomonadota bacterium]|nr:hypothetical protein [Pseudomonadota bacterium]